MSIETGLATLLLAQSAITTLVPAQTLGGTSYPAICNEEPTQGMVPPFIVITDSENDPNSTLDGSETITLDVDCYHYSKVGADAISAAVDAFFGDYTGPAGDDDTVEMVIQQNRTYRKLFNADGTDSRQRISSLTYRIWHSAT